MRCCREPFSGFSHLAGAILALAGLTVLIPLTWDQPGKMLSILIYGISMVLVYSASTALHLLIAPESTQQWLSRLDHAAIYALIAGSYTPFCYNVLTGHWRWGLLGIIWGTVAISMGFKLRFHRRKTAGRRGVLAYVGVGALGIVAAPQFAAKLPPGCIKLVLAGGAIYAIGAFIYTLDDPCCRPRYFNWHDLWHLCVLAGSVLHFTAVLLYIV